MSQKSISQLPGVSSLSNGDLLFISKDEGSSYTSKKVAYADIKAQLQNDIVSPTIWKKDPVKNIQTTPPGSPTLNDRYIVAPSSTGLWLTHDNTIATWNGSIWSFEIPSEGFTVWTDADNRSRSYDANTDAWIAGNIGINDHGLLTGLLDNDHPQYVLTSTTINSKDLSGNITLTASDVGAAASGHTHALSTLTGNSDNITEGSTKLFLTSAERTKLTNTSGTNTGDQNLSGLVVKANNLSDLTNSTNARTNLGLGTLATVTPTGVPDGTKFLRDDNSWQTVSSGGGTDASLLTSGTLDGDRLPALSTTKKGGVPATGTPSGKFLKDDGTWAVVSGGVLPSEIMTATTATSQEFAMDLSDAVFLTLKTIGGGLTSTVEDYVKLQFYVSGAWVTNSVYYFIQFENRSNSTSAPSLEYTDTGALLTINHTAVMELNVGASEVSGRGWSYGYWGGLWHNSEITVRLAVSAQPTKCRLVVGSGNFTGKFKLIKETL